MKPQQRYEYKTGAIAQTEAWDIIPIQFAASRQCFHGWRCDKLTSIETSIAEWNGAVASAVERVGEQSGVTARLMGNNWHSTVAKNLRGLRTPLHSDLILSVANPFLRNECVEGRFRTFGAMTMSENPEFMPTTQTEWPQFPYFTVEPGTPESLARAGLVMLGNPPGVEEDEDDVVGTPICSMTYARAPMVSVELRANRIPEDLEGAFLLNWSFRGRQGAMAKIFIDGSLDVPAFPVVSTDENPTPNFWTVLPMRTGTTIVDLKHVGAGFLWFEHCDVHSVIW